MANQMNVNRFRLAVNTSLETAAKLRTYVKGKTVVARSVGGRNIRKELRKMTVGDVLEQKAEEIVTNVKADKESLTWMRKQYEKNMAIRRAMDAKVRSGAYRKPRSEWLKPGRKPGKVYEKANSAMRELGRKRRAMTASGKAWRKSNGRKAVGN